MSEINPQPLEIRRVNPELIRKCIQILPEDAGYWYHETDKCAFAPADNEDGLREFDPFASPADREALMLALMDEKNGCWLFHKVEGVPRGVGVKANGRLEVLKDESFPMLLLKAVSAVSGLPVYLEE